MSEPINRLVGDYSHHEDPLDLAAVKAAGIIGVVWKATQGTSYADPTYEKYREWAGELELLWGAYHFADASDPQRQAEWFDETAEIGEGDLFCLDWEPNNSNTMNADQGRDFIKAIELVLDRPNDCVVYGSSSFLTEQIPHHLDSFYGERRLWLAQYGPEVKIPPTWKDYWLWQYAADGYGPEPRTIKGVDGFPDCNSYQGSEDQLRSEWTGGSALPPAPRPSLGTVLITINAPRGIEVQVVQVTTDGQAT